MKWFLALLFVAACGQVSSNQDAGGGDGTNGGPAVTVTVQGTGTGHVVSVPAGIDCPGACTARFPASTSVTLTAAPDSGAAFAGYTGGCGGLDKACTFTVDADQAVTATFALSGEKRFLKKIDMPVASITVDNAGKLVVAGTLPDFSGMYISSRSPTDGSLIWEQTYTGLTYTWLTTAPNGDIVLAAELVGTPIVGTRMLNNAGGVDFVVATFSATTGNVKWVKEFGGTGYDDANAVVVAPDNTIYLAGTFDSPSLVMGTTTMTNAAKSDAFLAAFDPNGNVLWAKEIGNDGGNEGIRGLTLDATGNVIASGTFDSTISFGSNLNFSNPNTPYADGFMVTVNKTNGANITAKQIGAAPEDVVHLADGGNVVAGGFQGSKSFGGTTFASHGSDDVFLVRYTAGGAHAWSTSFGSTAQDRANQMITDSQGAMLVAGYYYDAPIDAGGGPLSNAGMNDGFFVKLKPDGTHAWSYRYGGTMSDSTNAVAVDAHDNVYVLGTFSGTADVAGETLTVPTFAAFLVSYWP